VAQYCVGDFFPFFPKRLLGFNFIFLFSNVYSTGRGCLLSWFLYSYNRIFVVLFSLVSICVTLYVSSISTCSFLNSKIVFALKVKIKTEK